MKTQICESESLDAVPVGWKAAKLKYHAELNPKCKTQVTEDSEVTFTPMENIKNGYFIPGKEKYGMFAGNSQYAEYEEGDIAFAKVTPCFENDNIAIMQDLVNGKGFGSSELFVMRPLDIGIKYLFYLIQSPHFKAIGVASMTGTGGLKRVSSDAVRNYKFALPGAKIQNLISSYLDTKCAEIDKVVEQTRATIEEYKKLKQAIITEAVTKGVRGPRPMKSSGVEWIGDIPEEWEVRKVSQFWKANKGPNAAQLTAEYCGNHPGAYPVYSGQTENNGVMGMIDTYSFDFGARGCLFSTTVGAKAMTVSCLYNKFSLSQNCMIMQPLSEKCDVRYYFYLFAFIFGYFRSLIPDYMQPSFRVKDFLSYCMLLPSVIEQQEIATYLDTKCAEIDRIIQKKEQLIEELGSYKKSLIYEYVTGKKEVTA